ncbi:hypothetical protein [Geodermatophilus sp. SYSU D00815]
MSTEQYDPTYPPNPPAPQGYAAPAPQGYAAPQPGYGYPAPQQAPGNGLGVAGFVCGLVGLVLCWVPWIGMLLGLVGVVLGGIGISQGKKKGASTGLAIAGLVCGILAVLVWILLLAFVFSVASSLSSV